MLKTFLKNIKFNFKRTETRKFYINNNKNISLLF